MRFLPMDMSGQTGEKVLDGVGRPTALVKVRVRYPGLTFSGHIKSVDMGGEYYVWMEDGNYQLLMRFPGCDPCMINFKHLMGASVKAPGTYELIIDQDALKQGAVSGDAKSENVFFALNPVPKAESVLTCNGHKSVMINGVANISLPYGLHKYKVNFGDDDCEIEDSVNVIPGALNKVEVDIPLLFEIKGVRFRMMPVKGGSFRCLLGESMASDCLQRVFREEDIEDFYMCQTEVTQDLWKAVTGKNPSRWKRGGGSMPVENVSWEDCQKFIDKINKLTGLEFRLPTESEWEYAARGGDRSRGYLYAGGNDMYDFAFNIREERYEPQGKELFGHPRHVGMSPRNELGLSEMSGNVWEWCEDDYASDTVIGKRVIKNFSKVIKGGSWRNSGRACLPAMRCDGHVKGRYDNVGLRLVLSAGNIVSDCLVLKIAK